MNAVANFASAADRTRAVAGERLVDYLLVGIVSALLHFGLWQWLPHPSPAAPEVQAARVIKLILLAAPPVAVTPPAVVSPPSVTPPPPPPPRPPPRPKPKPRLNPREPLAPPPPVVDPPAIPRPAQPPPAIPAQPPAVTAPEPPIVPANTHATSAHNPKPAYPALARRRGWEGRVLLAVEVLVDGKPGTITLAATSGRELLDTAAIDAVRQWLFEPAQRAGRPIPSTLTLSIVFKLEK